MNNLDTRIPVLTPILMILKSRKFITAVVGFVVSLLVVAVPNLAPVRNELVVVAIVLALTLIGGITAEDVSNARLEAAKPPAAPDEQLRELIRIAVQEAMDKYVPDKLTTEVK